MKIKYIISLLFVLNLFKTNAQIIKDISELIGFDNIQGAYYKDTQNKLDAYLGTYTDVVALFKKIIISKDCCLRM
jgi:superoxide dismutase